MKRRHLVLEKIGLVFIGIIFIFSVKSRAGILIPINSATYNGPANDDDSAYGITVDGAENIIVTGKTFYGPTNYDYFTIKYNNDLSVVLGSATYNGPTNSIDWAWDVAVDTSENIIVTGRSDDGINSDYFTIKYNSDLSIVLGSATYDSSANRDDFSFGITIDAGENIIVTGYSNNGLSGDCFTIKYTNDLSVVLASTTYHDPLNNDNYWGLGVTEDGAGNIIVTGFVYNGTTTNDDMFTIKYNNDLSIVLASVTYNGPANSNDYTHKVVVDTAGNIVVDGEIWNVLNSDYSPTKYNSDLSVVLASATYNGSANNDDHTSGIIIDKEGNIIVVGTSENLSNDDYFIIKYNDDLSVVLASATYNGPANGNDRAYGIALDGDGNIIVTGISNNGINNDYFTIKYLGPPQLFSLSPSFGRTGETLDVIVNGLNFYNGASLVFSGTGITINSVDFISSTQLRVNVTVDDNAFSETRNVTITNIDEASGILPSGFEIRENIGYQEEEVSRFVKLSPKIITPNGDGINDVANFIFTSPDNETVEGMIFDLSGSVVRDNLPTSSSTSLTWDGRDNSGSVVSGKVYIYQIKIGDKVFNGTVVLAK